MTYTKPEVVVSVSAVAFIQGNWKMNYFIVDHPTYLSLFAYECDE